MCQSTTCGAVPEQWGEVMGGFVSLHRTAQAAHHHFSFSVGSSSLCDGRENVQHTFGTLWCPALCWVEHIILGII